MKLALKAITAIALFSSTSHAALSGFYDSAAKIQVALESSELANAMRQQPIDSLSVHTDENGSAVVIQSNGCGYAVHLTAQQPSGGRIGATTYAVEKVVGPMCLGAK